VVKFCGESTGALGESSFNITGVQAYNLENFVSTLFSRNERHVSTTYTESLRNELHSSFVGLSVKSGRIQPQDQLALAAA
jgi:hypothetical protein